MADAQTPTPAQLLAFLHGAGEIDGVSFGDRHPTLPGAFWWRRHLPMLAAQAPAQPDRALMQRVRDAITAYHLALDRREHGGVAAGCALDAIQDVLGMPWVQGAALSKITEKPASSGAKD